MKIVNILNTNECYFDKLFYHLGSVVLKEGQEEKKVGISYLEKLKRKS